MQFVAQILYVALAIFLGLMFVRLVVDWVQVFARSWEPKGPLLVVLEGVYSATDPPIKAVGRYVPPLRLGQVALDLSFMIVFVVCWLLMSIVGVWATSI